MKKAKIMLSAIALLAVVGGALAFKAHAKNDKLTYYFCNTAVVPPSCSSTAIAFATNIGTTTANGRNETITYTPGLTLDPLCYGLTCDNPAHPCTASHLYYQSTADQ